MYKLTLENKVVIRLSDNAFIPVDPSNSDFKEYQKWVAAGNTPEPADLPEEVVVELSEVVVSPWQFRKALNQLGLRQAVEGMVAASDNIEIKDGWEFTTEFRRYDPFIVMMAYGMGLSDNDLDGVFNLARTL